MSVPLSQPSTNPLRAVLHMRDFMLLWIGQATSMLGDQFHSIAGAWLILKITGDPLALGTVLAVGGIARAVFTVIGGAVTDRLSPRRVMLAADVIRLGLSGLLAAQIFTGTLQVWMLYLYALVGGAVGGFFGPASMSIVPRLLADQNLQAGNSLTQGSSQLIGFIGPAVAGGLIAAFKDVTLGVGIAIAFDALTFIVSIITLWSMRAGGEVLQPGQPVRLAEVFKSVGAGLRYMFTDPVLRLMFVIVAVANLSFGGSIGVGIPYLADTRFAEGAAAYGIIVAGYSGGNLLGLLLAGALPKLSRRRLQLFMIGMFAFFGVGIAALGWISVTWLATLDLFIAGVLNGYISILLITGLQRSTPPEMLGRMMSMLLLANMSLMPLAQALAGGLLRWNGLALFVISGALLLLVSVYLVIPRVGSLLSAQLVGGTDEAG